MAHRIFNNNYGFSKLVRHGSFSNVSSWNLERYLALTVLKADDNNNNNNVNYFEFTMHNYDAMRNLI